MDGIIVIDKPKGMTSREVVNKACKVLNTKHIGHTGTLDPLATGVLVLAVNKATKLVSLLSIVDKEYIATVRLGICTDTYDITGNIVGEKIVNNITREKLEKSLTSFIGSYEQEVPIFSAIHVDGKRLYEYARNKEEVLLPKKMVEIKQIELLDVNLENHEFSFSCTVSKGTYIRSLIQDIGKRLGEFSVMIDLRRIREGHFDLSQSITLEKLEQDSKCLCQITEAFPQFEKIVVDDEMKFKIQNGAKIKRNFDGEYAFFTDSNGKILALYQMDLNDKMFARPFKVFKIDNN